MKAENYLVLKNMLSELQQEYDEIVRHINDNSFKIQEADCFTNSVIEKEDPDFKIFSPRNAESVHKTEISQARDSILFYQNENDKLTIEKEKIYCKIEQLQNILSDESNIDYKVINIQEEDRQRIARDLHDTSLQNLAHLVHKIELCNMYIDKDPLHAKLELSVVSKNLKDIIEEIRNTIFDLRPMTFDDLGMKATIERLVSMVNENKSYEMDIDIDDVSCENNIVLVSIYRVIQECLTNIIKHAEATKICLHCKLQEDKYHVLIKDNGKGFKMQEIDNKERKHFGLSLMQERISLIGGNIVVKSDENGTSIEMDIPVK